VSWRRHGREGAGSAVGTDRAIGSRMKAPPADYLSWVFAIGRIEAICQPFASRTNVWL